MHTHACTHTHAHTHARTHTHTHTVYAALPTFPSIHSIQKEASNKGDSSQEKLAKFPLSVTNPSPSMVLEGSKLCKHWHVCVWRGGVHVSVQIMCVVGECVVCVYVCV